MTEYSIILWLTGSSFRLHDTYFLVSYLFYAGEPKWRNDIISLPYSN